MAHPFGCKKRAARTPRDAARRTRARAAIARRVRAVRQETAVRRCHSPTLASDRYRPPETHPAHAAHAWRCTALSIRRLPPAIATDAMASSRLLRGPKISGSATTAAASEQRASPGLRHADRGQIRIRQSPRRGKYARQPQIDARRIGELSPWNADQFADQPRRRRHGDLLPENGAHSQFESVPRTRDPQARSRCDKWRQYRVRPRCAPIASGSAARSKTRRTRAMIAGRLPRFARRTVALRTLPSAGSTTTTPCSPPIAIVRAYRSLETTSMPGIARARRNARMALPVVGRPISKPDRDRVRRADRVPPQRPFAAARLGGRRYSC